MTDQLTAISAPPEAASQLISNAVRHVFELSDKDFTRAVTKARLAFDELGCAAVSTTNWFRPRTPTFVGIMTMLAMPHAYRFEVEFHKADSYKAKIDSHDTYKMLQKAAAREPRRSVTARATTALRATDLQRGCDTRGRERNSLLGNRR